tara:strand:- start:7577 stop:7999 length:423 start_codon:yes stop_codon:yes gene_type:complete
MRYSLQVIVPGTKNLDYEADRLPGYSAEFTEAERTDALNQLDTIAPQVAQVRDLYNSSDNVEPSREAYIEIRPLYESQDAIVDTITYMPDSSLTLVPVDAIAAAPLSDAQKKTAYERLARLEVASLPEEIQEVLPDVVGD